MRKKIVAQLSLFDHSIQRLIAILKPETILVKIDKILENNPLITQAVLDDLSGDSKNTGRNGISAERIVRCAILKQLKRYPYRELTKRLNDGISLRWFTRFFSDPIPHYTTLQKSIKSIKPDTWKSINELIVDYSKKQKIENGRYLRVDTTVTETDIAYPIDARLLNDSVRVLTRLMKNVRENLPNLCFEFHDRSRTAKKQCYKIVMAKGPKTERIRRKAYRKLLSAANDVFHMAFGCAERLQSCQHFEALVYYDQIEPFILKAAQVIDQTERRVIKSEKVPTSEKIVSIFEDHTDIIKRGKSQCPTEFGHKILVASGKSGIITQYQCYRGNPSDGSMLPDLLGHHRQQYDKTPWHLCGDRRFFSAENEKTAYDKGVKRVSICKPGYRSKDRIKLEKERWFKKLQRFRAGIEGLISGLMRGYGLKRCLWKGWKSFQSYIGLGIVTFNLQKVATLT